MTVPRNMNGFYAKTTFSNSCHNCSTQARNKLQTFANLKKRKKGVHKKLQIFNYWLPSSFELCVYNRLYGHLSNPAKICNGHVC